MIAGGLSILLLVAALAWSDGGEVAALSAADAGRHASEQPLWVVDLYGSAYLRAASPHASWLARFTEEPVRVRRGETTLLMRAVPVADPPTRRAVNAAMARKYGWVDRLFGRVVHPGSELPVRLEPLTASISPSR